VSTPFVEEKKEFKREETRRNQLKLDNTCFSFGGGGKFLLGHVIIDSQRSGVLENVIN
jgi:hypothetical protein